MNDLIIAHLENDYRNIAFLTNNPAQPMATKLSTIKTKTNK
jgi:hypothetical protein